MSVLASLREASRSSGLPYKVLREALRTQQIPEVRLPGRTYPMVDLMDVERFISGAKSGAIENSEVPQMVGNKAPAELSQRRGGRPTKGRIIQLNQAFERGKPSA